MDKVEHEENQDPHDKNDMENRTFSYDVDEGIQNHSGETAEIEQQPSFEEIPFEEGQETNQTEPSFDPVSSFLGQATVERNSGQNSDIDAVFGFNFGNDVATPDDTDYHPHELDEGSSVDGFQCVNDVDESSRTGNPFHIDKNSDKSPTSVSRNPFVNDRRNDDSAKYVSRNPFIIDRNSDESSKIVSSRHSDVDRNRDKSETFVLVDHSDADRNSDKPASCMVSNAQLGEDNESKVPRKDTSNQYEADDESEVVDEPLKPESEHAHNSLNIISQLEDNGASGRFDQNETPVQGSSSTQEQTIRTRKLSVRFSDEVLVETYSDEEADSGDNYVCSVGGDGPFSPGPGDITTAAQGHRTELATSDSSSSTPSSSGTQVDVPAARSSQRTIVRRKDSVGTSLSPTDILRRKQKQVTDKIMKSIHVFRKPSDEFKKPKIISHKLDYKDVPSRNIKGSDHDRGKASESRNEEAVYITSSNPEQEAAFPVEKEQVKESKSVEHRVEEESPSKKHKTLLDRQSSRAALLIKQYSESKKSDDISQEPESESADNDQTRKKDDLNKAKQELSKVEINLPGTNSISVDPVCYSFSSRSKLQQNIDRKTNDPDSESADTDQTRKSSISVDPVSYRKNMDRINDPEYKPTDTGQTRKGSILEDPASNRKHMNRVNEPECEPTDTDQTRKGIILEDPASNRKHMDRVNGPEYEPTNTDQTRKDSILVDPVSYRRKYELADTDQTRKSSISVDPVSYRRKYELADTDQTRKSSILVDPVSYRRKYELAETDQTGKGSISVDPVSYRRKYELADTDQTRKSSISVDPVSYRRKYELADTDQTRKSSILVDPVSYRRKYELAETDQTGKGSISVDPVSYRRKYELADTDQTRKSSILVDPVSYRRKYELAETDQTGKGSISVDPVSFRRDMDRIDEPEYEPTNTENTRKSSISVDHVSYRRKYELADTDQTRKGSISVDPVSYRRDMDRIDEPEYEPTNTENTRKSSISVDPVSNRRNMHRLNEQEYEPTDTDQMRKSSISVDPVSHRRKYELADTDQTRKSSISVDPVSNRRNMGRINEPEYEPTGIDQTRNGSISVDPVSHRRKYELADTDQTRKGSISVDPVSYRRNIDRINEPEYELADTDQMPKSSISVDPVSHRRKYEPAETDKTRKSSISVDPVCNSFTFPSKLQQKVDNGERQGEGFQGAASVSYTSPSKLLRKNMDRQTNEGNGSGYGAFSYTSPSELLQKVDGREESEESFPHVTSFSYTSPSRLLRKNMDRQKKEENGTVYGAFSYTSPSELLFKSLVESRADVHHAYMENAGDSDNELDEEPGLWFFKRSNSSHHKGNTVETYTAEEQHKRNSSSEERRKSGIESRCNQDVYIYDDLTDNQTNLNDVQAVLTNMNALVSDFLDVMNEKLTLGEEVTPDDYQELCQFENHVETEINKWLKLLGYYEDSSRFLQFKSKTSEANITLARNLWAQMTHLTDLKHRMEVELHAKSVHNVEDKQNEEPQFNFFQRGNSSQHEDNLFEKCATERQQKGSRKREEVKNSGPKSLHHQEVSTFHDFTEDQTDINGVQAVLTGMNTLVTDFLGVMREKRKRGEEVTPDDYRELCQFEKTIEPTGNTWMKSTGRFEQGAQLENRASRENVALAQNLRAQLTQLADSKHRIMSEWYTKGAQTFEATQNEEAKGFERGNSTQHKDNLFETNASGGHYRRNSCGQERRTSDPDSIHHQEMSRYDDLSGDQTNMNDVQTALVDMNAMLADFLGVLNDKRGEEVTPEDYQELCQFEKTIETTVNSWLKYLGNFEQETHFGNRVSEENIAIAQNLLAQLKQLEDSKRELEADLHARISHTVGDEQNEAPDQSFSERSRYRHHEGNAIRMFLPEGQHKSDGEQKDSEQEPIHHQNVGTDEVAESQSSINDVQAVLSNMNVLVSDYLAMMNDKRNRGEEVTPEDYRELCLLEDIIEATVNKWLKSLGYFEQVSHLGNKPSEENITLAQNILAQLTQRADKEQELETDSHATTTQSVENRQDTIANRGNRGQQQEINKVSWATDKGSNDTVRSSKNLYKLDSTESGYLADVSSHSINESKTFMNGWMFSNGFLRETAPATTRRMDSAVSESVAALSSSASLDPDLWSTTSLLGDDEAVRGKHCMDCDCFECKKRWFYWNERFETDPHASKYESDDNGQPERPSPQSVHASRSAYARSRFKGTPHPSSFCLTSNPSFANLSDGGADMEDDVDKSDYESQDNGYQQQDMDSMAVSVPSDHSNVSDEQCSPRKVNMLTTVTWPEDTSTVRVDLGPSTLMLSKEDGFTQHFEGYDVHTTPECDIDTLTSEVKEDFRQDIVLKEGSPDRSQKLSGSSQNLDRRGETGFAKRKQAGRSLTPDSKFMFDKEVVETQNRKLQMEISTLQTENKLLKEKYNRSQGRISELEDQLADAQNDVTSLQQSLNRDVTSLSARTQHEIDRGRDHLQARVVNLTKENEALKAEVSTLEKQLESSNRTVDMVRHNTEKTRTLEAHKQEISSLKEELCRVKALLEQSERHLREEEDHHSAQTTQVIKLTELKNALQQQQAAGSGGTVGDKQLKSLEKRLKVTEERLHQERADRANNLSAVEDKLLTENARLQAVEKDLTRQLHREKDKNRNLDQRVRQVRDENEKLRLAMPFDDAKLLDDKQSYDIPYSSHSNQRAETMKHISDDMNYILSQIEKHDGLCGGKSDHEEMIRTLWNKREMAYQQLRQYEVSLQELHLNDNNVLDGLKNLRDTYGQAESKLHSMEEQVADAQTQMINLEATYKEQLNILVHERHDAFARLKTAEDILEAVRAENELLRQNTQVVQSSGGGKLHNGGSLESLQMEIANLESKVAQLTRTNQKLEGELSTAKTQVECRNKTLQDVQSELELTYNRLKGQDGGDDRKQLKIDKLSSEVSGLQVENKMVSDKYNTALAEKSRLESELTELRKLADVQKLRQQKTGHTEGKVQQQLKDSLAEKEGRLSGLTRQLTETEGDLQKLQQDLYIEQMHNTELEAEVEQLRQTVDQRAQMFEALSGTEREQLAQYTMLKETLDTVNQELAQKHAQIISLDVNLSSQRDRAVELEAELERLRADRGDQDTQFSQEEQRSAQQLRTSELEKERGQLKQELVQAYNAIKAAEEQYRTLQSESAQLEQELVKEKTVILQITAEKGEVEQHLEELAEEHDSLIQEKNQAEEDLIRLETKLQEILAKYETEARKQHANFTQEYPDLPQEARKLVSELDSLRLLVDGKDREISMLQDKINRQQIDIEFLNRKVELVHNDSISNREDVARMISELTLKMKEAVSTREVNQFLVAERTKLQNEKTHMELELEQERQNNDKRKKEIGEVLRKVQGTESKQKTAVQESKDKAIVIASLETDLRSTQMNYSTVESEMARLKSRLEQQNGDVRNLTQINATVEQQLEMEKTSLLEERSALSKLREEFNRVSHDHELLQHEHAVLCDKHEADLQTVENLRKELSAKQEETATLHDELHAIKLDLETQKGQLFITKDTLQKLTKDKETIYQDYEGMCRTVTEKERQLLEIRERGEEKVDHLTQLHGQEKSHLIHDKLAAEQERDEYRRDHESLKTQLEQKEIQLNTFGKTLSELEAVTRQKKQLEAQLHQLESSSGDSKVLLEGQRKELMALNEALAKQQDRSTRIEAENHTLKAELKTQKDALNRECKELSITVKELKSQHENERTFLNDNLAKTQSHLRSVEASLVTASSERDTLQAQKRMTEKSLEDLKAQLTDEATGRRLAEQSVGTLRLQMEDMRNEKNTSEAHYVEMKSQLAKAEDQLKSEMVRKEKLSARMHELTATTNTTESTAKAKTEQVETLQKEVNRLKQVMESQKQNMIGKLKKAQLEFKQQLDRVQEDRDKLVQQLQKISTDLEACREQLTLKNKDNLKLQEDNLVLQDSVKESKAKQKHAEEALREETDKLSSMASKFMQQDEELKRLRNFLAKKVEDSGDADKSMWQEMNRVIQDLSRQMQDHLDAQKSEGKDSGQGHHQVALRYKKQLAEVQSELSTEKSLHAITRTSLSALEEDCQRLRHQLHAMRRREPTHSTEKKYKNRMEAINAIIARSQTQAQALLASGGYSLDPMTSPRVPNSARPGYGSPSHRPESPDNSYTEDLSIASLPPLHYGSSTQK